ncbi:MAG: hypothetical protein GX307_06295 [Euryarchaeota archaeon]|nr:hypothetical protein [Euryarchaeota archaeon]
MEDKSTFNMGVDEGTHSRSQLETYLAVMKYPTSIDDLTRRCGMDVNTSDNLIARLVDLIFDPWSRDRVSVRWRNYRSRRCWTAPIDRSGVLTSLPF